MFKLQVDSAADYLFQSSAVRGSIQYPAPFGRDATPEEAKIAELDAKTGASLKVINSTSRMLKCSEWGLIYHLMEIVL